PPALPRSEGVPTQELSPSWRQESAERLNLFPREMSADPLRHRRLYHYKSVLLHFSPTTFRKFFSWIELAKKSRERDFSAPRTRFRSIQYQKPNLLLPTDGWHPQSLPTR